MTNNIAELPSLTISEKINEVSPWYQLEFIPREHEDLGLCFELVGLGTTKANSIKNNFRKWILLDRNGNMYFQTRHGEHLVKYALTNQGQAGNAVHYVQLNGHNYSFSPTYIQAMVNQMICLKPDKLKSAPVVSESVEEPTMVPEEPTSVESSPMLANGSVGKRYATTRDVNIIITSRVGKTEHTSEDMYLAAYADGPDKNQFFGVFNEAGVLMGVGEARGCRITKIVPEEKVFILTLIANDTLIAEILEQLGDDKVISCVEEAD